jgi:tripartite-type tricarboxylate transporter receptor subunit TctC
MNPMKLFLYLLAMAPVAAIAGSYPDHPIKLIVPYAAGGGTDTAARLLAKDLATRMGQPVIVENKAGAATQIGTAYVARSAPDGYTLLMGTANLATNAVLYKKLPYDVQKDLAAVVQVTDVPVYIFTAGNGPIKDLATLMATAKESGGIAFATAGVGSIPHLAGELFAKTAHLKLRHIPYKGSSEAVVAVASGQPPISLDNLPPAYAMVKSGKLKPLAIAAKSRNPSLPDVPTLTELGYPIEASSWWGVMAPARTPSAIIDKLNKEVGIILAQPKFREFFIQQGMYPVGGSPQQFTQYIAAETEKWRAIVKDINIQAGD